MPAREPVEVTVEIGDKEVTAGLSGSERERAAAVAATPRTLGKADFLLGVRDDTREGSVRFRQPGSDIHYTAHRNAVPRLIEVARLLRGGALGDGRRLQPRRRSGCEH